VSRKGKIIEGKGKTKENEIKSDEIKDGLKRNYESTKHQNINS
jgi:hypothetical protein